MAQFMAAQSVYCDGAQDIGAATGHPKRQGKEGIDACHSYSVTATSMSASSGYSRLAHSWTIDGRPGPAGASDEVNQLMSTIAEQPGKGLAPYGTTGWQLAQEAPAAESSLSTSCKSMFGMPSLRKFCSYMGDKSDLTVGSGLRTDSSTEFNRGSKFFKKSSSWFSAARSSTIGSSASLSSSEPSSPGVFSPNTQSNWMNLTIGEESSSSSDSCQSVDWAPKAQADPDDLATPRVGSFGSLNSCFGLDGSATPLVGALHQFDDDDELLCETPLATPLAGDQPGRTGSGRRSCSGKVSSASSVRGPRPLMKPPPIHRSKLYKRRLQHRSKATASKSSEPGSDHDDAEPSRSLSSGAEHKLATFKLQTLGLKSVVC